MSDAEQAYKAAEAQIAKAKEAGLHGLDLTRSLFEHLERLPPAIAELTDLRTLKLTDTRITDLTPLAGLSALQRLNLRGTQVADIAPLAGLPALQTLNLRGTEVADIAPLAGLSAVQELYLIGTQVADIAPLARLPVLQRLDLGGTQVADIAPLAGLPALQELYLNGTEVADIAPLAGLPALQVLDLRGTQVADIAPLAGLPALQRLYLIDTQVADIAPLAGLSALQSLYLNGTQVADLRPIVEIDALIEGATSLGGGLHFTDIPATRLDPEGLGRLSKVKGNQQRTRETLAYLKGLTTWPPGAPTKAPDQEEELSVAVGAAGADVAAAMPDADELRDRVKRTCHEQLKSAAQSFARVADNRHMNVAQRGWRLAELADAPFEDLNLLLIHIELEKLRELYERRAEREGEEALTPDEVDALSDLLTIGPGLVRDNEDVEAFEKRRNRPGDASSEERIAAENAIVAAIRDDTAVMGETLRAYAGLGAGAEPLSSGALVRKLITWNMVIAGGGYVLDGVLGGTLSQVGVDLVAWLKTITGPLYAYAATQGPAFSSWIGFVMEHLRQNAGAMAGVTIQWPPKPGDKK